MKKKITVIILIIAYIFIHIEISSTIIISKNIYRKIAWALVDHNKTIINWETANVTIRNIKEKPIRIAPTLSAKIGSFLLCLNDGRFVAVEFTTIYDDLLGPMVLYFNPFTKQCIGGELRR